MSYKHNKVKIGFCKYDYFQVYSDSTDASYIEQKRQCLYHETNISPNPMISVDVTILKSTGNRVGRRSTTTTIMVIWTRFVSFLNADFRPEYLMRIVELQ